MHAGREDARAEGRVFGNSTGGDLKVPVQSHHRQDTGHERLELAQHHAAAVGVGVGDQA
jgi:hypothetical protein